MRTPVISVVMSAFNAAATLDRTIDSILGQTEGDFELIAIDDGSTDATREILERRAADDARIQVVARENRGLTRALVDGCRLARGIYIARHDTGDWSAPERFAMQRALLDADERIAFVSCWTEYVGPGGEHLFVSKGTGEAGAPIEILDESRPHGVRDGPTAHPAVMFRRSEYEACGGYRAQFYYGQDWDLWYRLAVRGAFQMIPRVLYFATYDPGSISARARSRQTAISALSHRAMLARLRGEPEENILAEAAAIRPGGGSAVTDASAGLYFVGETLRRNGDPRARGYLLRALRENPLMLRAWIRAAQSLVPRRRGR